MMSSNAAMARSWPVTLSLVLCCLCLTLGLADAKPPPPQKPSIHLEGYWGQEMDGTIFSPADAEAGDITIEPGAIIALNIDASEVPETLVQVAFVLSDTPDHLEAREMEIDVGGKTISLQPTNADVLANTVNPNHIDTGIVKTLSDGRLVVIVTWRNVKNTVWVPFNTQTPIRFEMSVDDQDVAFKATMIFATLHIE